MKTSTETAVAGSWTLSLIEVVSDLAGLRTAGDLCRRAVALGALRLGFSRLAFRGPGEGAVGEAIDHAIDSSGRPLDHVPQLQGFDEGLTRHQHWELAEDVVIGTGADGTAPRGTAARAGIWRRDGLAGVLITWSDDPAEPVEPADAERLSLLALQIGLLWDRLEVDHAFASARTHLHHAQRLAHMGSWTVDLQNRRATWSDEMFAILGVEPDGLRLSRGSLLAFVHPEDRELVAEAMAQTAEGRTQFLEFRVVRPDGEERLFHSQGELVLDGQGQPVAIFGMTQDITERSRATAELERNELALRRMHDACSAQDLTFDVRVQRLLELGCERFDLGVGVFAHIDGDLFTVLNVVAPPEFEVTAGAVLDLGQTFCLETMRSEEPVSFLSASRSPWAGHPAYRARPVESYLAIQVRVAGKPYGTLSFSSMEGRSQPFSHGERDIIRLMGQWIGTELARIHAEEALSSSRERYQSLMNAANDAVLVVDTAGGCIVDANERAQEMTGRSRDELLSLRYGAIHGQPAADALLGAGDASGASSGSGIIEGLEVVTPEEQRLPVEISARVVEVAGRTLTIAILRDITERRRTEEALRETNDRYDRLSANVPAMLYQYVQHADGTPQFVYASPGLQEFFHAEVEELMNDAMAALGSMHPDDQGAYQAAVASSARTMEPFRWEGRFVVDGEIKWLQAASRPKRLLEGAILWDGVALDVTGTKRMEEQTRRLQDELAHVHRLNTMGEMATGLAHELNQPLATIVNYAEGCQVMLESGDPDLGEVARVNRKITSMALRAAQIIQRMRALVRKGEPRRVPLELNNLILEVAGIMSADTRLGDISVALNLADDLPPTAGDPVQIMQVVLNLFRNAVEVLDGEDDQEISLRTYGSSDGGVAFELEDTGPGLPANLGQEVFEPFVSTKAGGTGMGLSISRSIIEAHGGRLSAEPRAGRGTVFRFTLPRGEE